MTSTPGEINQWQTITFFHFIFFLVELVIANFIYTPFILPIFTQKLNLDILNEGILVNLVKSAGFSYSDTGNLTVTGSLLLQIIIYPLIFIIIAEIISLVFTRKSIASQVYSHLFKNN
jgi:hypothetical protein